MQNANLKNNNGPHPWTWFTDKILPPLIVALCLAVSGGIYSIYRKIDEFGTAVNMQQREIDQLKGDMSYVKSNMVTQPQMLETLKRIEQQLEIMMLRAGIQAKFKETP